MPTMQTPSHVSSECHLAGCIANSLPLILMYYILVMPAGNAGTSTTIAWRVLHSRSRPCEQLRVAAGKEPAGHQGK